MGSFCHRLGNSIAGVRLRFSRLSRHGGAFAFGVLLLLAATLVVAGQPWVSPSQARAPQSAAGSVTTRSPISAVATGDPKTAGVATTRASETAADPSPLSADRLTGYVWPVADARVTLPFGTTNWGDFVVDGRRFHDGVDMATFCGDKIVAAHDGVVLAAGRHFDDYMGWQGDLSAYYARLDAKRLWNYLPIMVVIDDGNGYRSLYAHMYVLKVKVGQRVTAGQLIGYEGMTGNATGCHLHYGLFSPLEKMTMELEPSIASRMLLPAAETARVNPLLVLPFRCGIEEMRPIRPSEANGCPSPSPRPRPSPRPSPSPRPAASRSATVPPSTQPRTATQT